MNPYKKTITSEQLKTFMNDSLLGILSGNEILNKETLKEAKNIRIISRCGVGFNNIDVNYLKRKNIKLSLTDDEHVIATVELALLHMLASLRKLAFNIDLKNFNNWERKKGFLLTKKKIGLIGLGKIGKKLAKILSHFNCKIFYYDLIKNKKFNFAKLNTILKSCDIISLHIPLTKKTTNLINLKNLKLLKKNAILLNLSRGNIINELEKNESIDKKLLRYLTVKVKDFDLDANYFSKKESTEKKESSKN